MLNVIVRQLIKNVNFAHAIARKRMRPFQLEFGEKSRML